MADAWVVGLVANGTAAVAFFAVAVALLLSAIKSDQWRRNPLGVGTVLLYSGCAGGHAVHFLQLLGPAIGWGSAIGLAARVEYSEWHPWAIDILTAAAGVWYWVMRRRFPALVSGAAVFEDLRGRQQRALEIHDNVVQGLARAKLAIDMGLKDEGEAAVNETMEAANRIVTGLLGHEGLRPSEEAPS